MNYQVFNCNGLVSSFANFNQAYGKAKEMILGQDGSPFQLEGEYPCHIRTDNPRRQYQTSITIEPNKVWIVEEVDGKIMREIRCLSVFNSTVLPLTSEKRGEPYSMEEAIGKGLLRSQLEYDGDLEVRVLIKNSGYGDWDGVLRVTNLRPSSSRWGNSIDWSFTGELPIHVSAPGSLSVGFGCGADISQDSDAWSPKKGYKKYPLKSKLTFFVGEQSYRITGKKLARLLQDVLNNKLAEAFLPVVQRLFTEWAVQQLTKK